MDSQTSDENSAIFKDMASFDFTKPFRVNVTIEHTCCSNQEESNEGLGKEKKRPKKNNDDCIDVRSILFSQDTNHNLTSSNFRTNECAPEIVPTARYENTYAQKQNDNTYLNSPASSSEYTSCNNISCNINCRDINEQINKLNFVTKNLVQILKAFYYLIGKDRIGLTNDNMRQTYQRKKEYYFGLSRDIAVCELLPQRHNKIFVKAFLNKIKILASYEGHFTYLGKTIVCLYREFIIWISSNNNETMHRDTVPFSKVYSEQVLNNAPTTVLQHSHQRNFNIHHRGNLPHHEKVADPQSTQFRNGRVIQETNVGICIKKLNDINKQNGYMNMSNNEVINLCNFDTFSSTRHFLNNQILNQDFLQTELNRAQSVSGDSGFGSPCHDNIIDLCSDVTNKDTANSITNVTHIASQVRPCRICGIDTIAKCTKCHHVSYCSPVCQTLDWSKHKNNCSSN